ncbi:DUF4193 domain-containing protein [Georgenia sp. AZ-5]|uniref:DUF4193 domain-containing protein n=1 Tax=Georgenia sp. AZ-5 TaxID=3367526 RepID=UPI0037541345
MTVNYDAPRDDEEQFEGSLEALATEADAKNSNVIDAEDEMKSTDGPELPYADLSSEELTVRVLPPQADEFTCSHCFLVHHHSQLAYRDNGHPVCAECAA